MFKWNNTVCLAAVLASTIIATRHARSQDGVWVNPSMGSCYPIPTFGMAATYDAARGEVLFFGGTDGAGRVFDETWSWNGRRWKRYAATGPVARVGARMVYDSTRQVVLLIGGNRSGSGQSLYLGDVWEWDGRSWTQRPGISPREAPHVAYDSRREVVVVYSGTDTRSASGAAGDLIEFDGIEWTSPPQLGARPPNSLREGAMTFDEVVGKCFLVGGTASGPFGRYDSGAYTWDGTHWESASDGLLESGGRFPAAVFASDLDGVLLITGAPQFGSITNNMYLGHPGDPGFWQRLLPANQTPRPRVDFAYGYDTSRSVFVRWGVGVWNDLWEWHPNGQPVPEERCLADMNDDGGIDAADVDAFFIDWSSALCNADINADGGIDFSDVEAFFLRWENGC